MPGVIRTGPHSFTYRRDDGQEFEVARGQVPELDHEADAFDQRMGGAGASAPMANLEPPPGIALDPTPAGPQMSRATDAVQWDMGPGGFAAAAGVNQPAPAAPTDEGRAGVAQIDTERRVAREGLRPGLTFQAPAAPSQAANPGVLVTRRGGGGGGPRVTARMTQQIANPIDPAYGEDIGAAGADLEGAQSDVAAGQVAQARGEASIRRQAEAEQNAAIQGRQQSFDRYQQRVAEQQAVIDADMQRYQDLSSDPFAGKGTDQKLLAIIGVALGGLGAALSGGDNQALAILQEQMAQEREAAREKIRSGQGRLAELRDSLGSEQAALDAHMAGIHERLASRLQNLSADMADTQMADQMAAKAAESRLAAAQARAQAAQAAAGTGEIVTERRAGGGGGPGRQVLIDPRTGVEINVDQAMRLGLLEGVETEEDGTPRIPGLAVADPEAARSLEAADLGKIRERAGMLLSVRHQMDRLVELSGRGIVSRRADPQTLEEYNAIRADLQTAITVAAGQGALSQSDADRVNNQIPSLDNLVSAPERAARLRDAYLSGQNQRLRPYGYRLEGMAPQTAGAPVVRGR